MENVVEVSKKVEVGAQHIKFSTLFLLSPFDGTVELFTEFREPQIRAAVSLGP